MSRRESNGMRASQILDLRGRPTLQVSVGLDGGAVGAVTSAVWGLHRKPGKRSSSGTRTPIGSRPGVERAVMIAKGEIAEALRSREWGARWPRSIGR
jgi:hypothetical protein